MRIKKHIKVPVDVIRIKDVFVSNGFKLFVVGGAVRDSWKGVDPKDFDLATDAHPDKVKEMLGSMEDVKSIPIGVSFGVWQAMTESGDFEIATFRKDLGSGRRPDEVEFSTIEIDVLRRDLTINALFYDIDTEEIVDLVGGIYDLENGIIRAVGKAEYRFLEDKLRIPRAVRFASALGSKLDKDIVDAIKKDSTPVSGDGNVVSSERIRDEFVKSLKTCKSPVSLMMMMDEFNLFSWLFSEDFAIFNDVFVDSRSLELHLFSLLGDNGKDEVLTMLNEKTFSNLEIRKVSFFFELYDFLLNEDSSGILKIKKLQNKISLSIEELFVFVDFYNFNSDFAVSTFNFSLSIGGLEAKEAGVKSGPEMGEFIVKKESELFKDSLAV